LLNKHFEIAVWREERFIFLIIFKINKETDLDSEIVYFVEWEKRKYIATKYDRKD
jgi:hypothetical protein